MRPTDKFVYGPHSTGSHAPFLFGIVGGVGFLLVVLIIVVLAAVSRHACIQPYPHDLLCTIECELLDLISIQLVIMIVVIKRTTHRHTRLPQTPEVSHYHIIPIILLLKFTEAFRHEKPNV